MEYTIQELSRLSGVTTRALRWYDEIGLLKPSGRTESGSRRYGPAEVDRLQDILYYRALGVELARIRACLDDPAFDRLAALREHLSALEREQGRLQKLIESVKETIMAQERKKNMSDEKKFEAFKRTMLEEYEKTHEAESRARYGDGEVDAMLNRIKGVTWEQYAEWERLEEEVLQKLSAAVAAGADPAGSWERKSRSSTSAGSPPPGTNTTYSATGELRSSMSRTSGLPPTTTGSGRAAPAFSGTRC